MKKGFSERAESGSNNRPHMGLRAHELALAGRSPPGPYDPITSTLRRHTGDLRRSPKQARPGTILA
jgi:hypothetical protein